MRSAVPAVVTCNRPASTTGGHDMSTVSSADGTVIDYDRYGDGPAVIFLGGAATYRAIDQATTQTAKHLAAEGFTGVDDDRRGRGRSGDTPPWGLSFTAHLAVLRALLADGNNEEVMRYNLTSVIGLPAEVVDGMARSCARVTRASPACPRPPTRSPPPCPTPAAAPCQGRATGRPPRRSRRC
jgi:hypothetical protein